MYLQCQDLHVFELVSSHGLHIFPIRFGGCFSIGHYERKLEDFNAREAASGIARQCPDDINHAVFSLVIQLHRCAAQLHSWVGFKLDTTTRFFFNLVHPRFVHVQPNVGLRCHEGMKLECHHWRLRQSDDARSSYCCCNTCLQKGTTLNHVIVSKKLKIKPITNLKQPYNALKSNAFTEHSRHKPQCIQRNSREKQQKQGAQGVAD